MIKFDEKKKIFHLYNNYFSYYMVINPLGYLVHLYSGKYLNSINTERSNEKYIERYTYLEDSKIVCDEDYYFSEQVSKFECAPYLCADKRGAFAVIEYDDGTSLTRFEYFAHEIVSGKKVDTIYPHARIEEEKKVQTLVITLKEERKEVYLRLYYSIFDDAPILIRNSEIINKEEGDIKLKRLASLELDLFEDNYTCISMHGSWSQDRVLEESKIGHSKLIIGDNHGARGFYHNPSIMIKEENATFDTGEVYAMSLIYSGNFAFEMGKDEINQTRILSLINDESFSFTLKKDEHFTTPECVMVYSDSGINRATNVLHDFIRNYILPKKFAFAERPILINSWEAYYFDFDTEKILKLIDEAKAMGIEMVVLDDGWFKGRNSDKTSLGDRTVNEEKIDLKRVIKYAHDNKMKFGLWVEPEMISPRSDLYKKHPEYALYNRDTRPNLLRNQLVLDLTNPTVVDEIFAQIEKIFDEYKPDYCKRDFNRYLSEIGSPYLGKEKEGEVYHRFTLGSYALLDKFVKRFPDILLETCASGGGRFDLGMLYYSPQIWGSDETSPFARVDIQFATNMFYPLSTIGAHVSAQTLLGYQEKAIIAAFGTFGYELDPLKLSDEDKTKIKEINKLIKDWHHVVTEGDYYAIKDPTKSNYAAWNIVSKNKKECLVFHFNFKKEPTFCRYIKLKGLDPNAYYFNSLTNDIYKGDFYMNVGLNISAPIEEGKAMLFVLKQVRIIEKVIYERVQERKKEKREKII